MKTQLRTMALVLLLAGATMAAEIEICRPAETAIPADARAALASSAEPWIIRTGSLQMAPQFVVRLRQLSDRDTLKLSLFPTASMDGADGAIRVEVRGRPRTTSSGGLSVSGACPGSPLQTALFTVVGQRLMATVEDLESGRIYQIIGDGDTGVGHVTVIDRRAMPPAMHLPPLVPEREDDKGEERP
jgi:hypothetical protein